MAEKNESEERKRKLKRTRTVDVKSKYKIRQKLGSGSFATVRRVVDKSTGENFALKMIRKKGMNKVELNNLKHEIEILKQIRHEHCIQMYDLYITSTYTYLITDYCSGGELFDVLTAKQVLTEEETSQIIRQLALALHYLHNLNIVHRDIKPENILLCDNSVNPVLKICDFGLARVVPKEGLTQPCGTPTYVAPEVIKEEKYGVAADWWSLGVILYLLLCGFPPFWDEDPKRLFRKIKSGFIFFPKPYWDHVSIDARNLILGLLCVPQTTRYRSRQVLNHTWIKREASVEKMSEESRKCLRRYFIQTKMRRAVHTVRALTKLVNALVDFEVGEVIQQRNELMSEMFTERDIEAAKNVTENVNEESQNKKTLSSFQKEEN